METDRQNQNQRICSWGSYSWGGWANFVIAIHQVQPAPPATAKWVQELLNPVIQACRLDAGFPIEFRPTGVWAGWAHSKNCAPDGRVSLSSRLLILRKSTLVSVYIHEATHQLLNQVDPGCQHGHDPAFFALNLLMLRRLDGSTDSRLPIQTTGWATSMSLYDLQDPPPPLSERQLHEWQPRALAWALRTVHEIHNSYNDLTAAACSREIVDRYNNWTQALGNTITKNPNKQSEHRTESPQLGFFGIPKPFSLAVPFGLGSAVLISLFFILRKILSYSNL